MKSLNSKIVLAIAACVMVVGCKQKPGVTDQPIDSSTMGGSNTPGITDAPLSYDVAGSDSGKIDGLVTVHFGYDKANLDASAKKEIAGNADWMKKNSNTKIQIEGHCDARGTIEYNVALGERRAGAVKKYMVSLGIKEDRLSIISYGKEKPVATGETEEAYGKNRRANFLPIK